MNYVVKSISGQVNDVDTKEGIVKFAFAHFGSLDFDGDIIQKGAYAKTVKENGPKGKDKIFHYKNHNHNMPVGKPMEIFEEGNYMVMVSKLSKNTYGRDALIEYEEGIIKEHSQGFYIVKDNKEERKSGEPRIIREVSMIEASSLSTWAANENTPVFELKTFKSELDKRLRIGSFSDGYLKELEELKEYLNHFKPEQPLKADEDEQKFSELYKWLNNIKVN